MKRLKTILSDVLEISVDDITGETQPETVESWDSFNGLMLVSELEARFNVKFTMDEVTSVKCVNDIKNSLVSHGIELKEDE